MTTLAADRRRLVPLMALALALSLPGSAEAHPLGNFSINHYAGLTLRADSVDVRYVIDRAEIPTFQEIQDSGITPEVGHPALGPYLERQAVSFGERLALTVDGRRLPLDIVTKDVIFPPGAGGLPTMKIGVRYRARLTGGAGPVTLRFEDNAFPGRAGWKEIVVTASPGVTISTSTAPTSDRSSELSDYPTDLLQSPPQDVEARVVFTREPVAPPVIARPGPAGSRAAHAPPPRTRPALTPAAPPATAPVPAIAPGEVRTAYLADPITLTPNRQSRRDAFTSLIETRQRGLGIVFVALVVAAGLGAFHALEPGHGKTVVAAYLVGAQGTGRHAVLLGCIVTASHTFGVYVLGAVTLYASRYVVPERLYPWLGMVSGLTIAGLGFWLFLQRYADHDSGHGHSHRHGGHAHAPGLLQDHDHHHAGHEPHPEHHSHGAHRHDHHHHHATAGERITPRQLVALGITGGIVPCPAALVVLLSALSFGRVGFGLLLIVAFSIGLAAVLIAIGLLMVYARRLMGRLRGDGPLVARWLPLTSAAVMTVLGVAIAFQALATAGIVHVKL